jgi:hypothetical protein
MPDPPPGKDGRQGTGPPANKAPTRKGAAGIAASLTDAAAHTSMQDIEALLRADPVSTEDITQALRTTKPSSDGKITK